GQGEHVVCGLCLQHWGGGREHPPHLVPLEAGLPQTESRRGQTQLHRLQAPVPAGELERVFLIGREQAQAECVQVKSRVEVLVLHELRLLRLRGLLRKEAEANLAVSLEVESTDLQMLRRLT